MNPQPAIEDEHVSTLPHTSAARRQLQLVVSVPSLCGEEPVDGEGGVASNMVLALDDASAADLTGVLHTDAFHHRS
jgi:hypothetical protein